MSSGRIMNLTIVLALAGSSSVAAPVSVGTGVNWAEVYIEWSDGFIGEFEVCFGQSSSDTVTGADLLLTLDSELTDFTLAYTNWGTVEEPDLFVDSIQYLGHYSGGYGGGEDWWHYWIRDWGDTGWTSPLYGVSSRVVGDGDMDGWIYGRGGAPVPEPATVVLLAGGVILLRRRRYG
ncbi:MAG: PEP-CTERM sorting domain-containing protein [Planctomycetota bacterium]|nr:MAG: PEP-CTERM sorting domain-containing protein [Planctomycetota bacterium]